ncbi:hypothetical protein J4204_06140 [Candidatus Woesearchaeota archaeon]|nr:hypothetical protein [Candidatus Woesearchaeota archaeon]
MENLIFVKEAAELAHNVLLSSSPVSEVLWIRKTCAYTRALYTNIISPELENLYLYFKGDVISEKSEKYLPIGNLEHLVRRVETEQEKAAVVHWCKEDFERLEPLIESRNGWNLLKQDTARGTYAVHTYSPPQ